MADFVTCNKCGWVYYAVTEAEAIEMVAGFNAFYNKLSDKRKSDYGGPSTIDRLYKCYCGCGGSYKNFHKTEQHEIKNGTTLNPIISDLNG